MNQIRLYVWGDYACFTRPEMKVERVSYDVMTPSAARGILSAIHWKPAIHWVVDKIHVLRPIRFESVRRNEVSNKISISKASSQMKRHSLENLHIFADDSTERQQRATTALKDVAYVIEAHVVLTGRAGDDDNIVKHLEMFKRRARRGQCFQQPCLGTREFAAYFSLLESEETLPPSMLTIDECNRDLGWMLHDIDFKNGNTPHFFRAEMKDGVIEVPPFYANEVKA